MYAHICVYIIYMYTHMYIRKFMSKHVHAYMYTHARACINFCFCSPHKQLHSPPRLLQIAHIAPNEQYVDHQYCARNESQGMLSYGRIG